MNNINVFDDSWHKISDLRVCLLNSISIQKQILRGKEIYVLKEPYNNKYFKVSKEAYNFISRLSLEKTVQEVMEDLLQSKPDESPSQNEIVDILSSLHSENMLYFKNLAENDFIFERNKDNKLKQNKNKIYSFLYFKIPLINPNKLLDNVSWLIKIVFSKYGFIVWLLICLLGLKSAIDNIGPIFDQAQGMLSPKNLILLYFSLAIMKLFHELAHSSVIKKYGGSVNTLGIMFLILTPLPYMDATHSWFFKNKYHRIFVSFAGMMSDLLFAAVATIVWANTGDGIVHSIAFNIMIIGSVSSLLFNGNPLLRFDAYYMLADYLEIPNLAQKSKEYFLYFTEKILFKVENQASPSHSEQESFLLFGYALVSYLYRIIITLGIIIYVADQVLLVGILMAIISAVMWIFIPLKKFIMYLFNSTKLYKTRNRALMISATISFMLIYFIFFIPISNSIKANGIIESTESVKIYAKTEGIVEKIFFKNGDYVKQGDTIAILKNVDLEFDIRSLEISLEEVDIARQKLLYQAKADIKALNEKKDVFLEKLKYLEEKQKLLTIKAETSGVFVSNSFDNLLHSFVKRQSLLGTIVRGNRLSFFAVVTQEQAYELFEKKEIVNAGVKFFGQSQKALELENINLIPYARDELPSAALGWFGGGEISVSNEDNDGKKTTELFFEISGVFKENEEYLSILKEGRTGVLKIELQKSPLSEQLFMKLNQLLQKRYKI